MLATASPAPAYVAHTVEPGETLWSIAAASNLTTRALAASNGLPEDAQVVVGTTVKVPSEAEAAAALGTSAAPATADSSAPAQAAGTTSPWRLHRPGRRHPVGHRGRRRTSRVGGLRLDERVRRGTSRCWSERR